MRRLAIAVALLAIAGAVALWWLPRWLAGDDARERLVAAARRATGRDVAIEALSAGLLPPRLIATDVRIGDAAAPLVRAERIDLRLDPGGLLSRTLLVEEASLRGVVWRVVRTPNGVELPWTPTSSAATTPGAAEVAAAGAARGLDLAVRRVELRDSQIVWDDPVATPPVRLTLDGVGGGATTAGPNTPLALTLDGTLAGGGTLKLVRDAASPGAPDLEVTLAGVDVATIAPYLGENLALSGKLAGTLALRGPARSFEAVDAAFEIADASVQAGDVTAQGPVAITAKLAGAIEALTGHFELDASRAELAAYGGAFRKPPGAPAKATGQLVRDARGKLGVDNVRVKIEKMDGASLGIDGAFRATPDGFRSEGLVARSGDDAIAIDLRVDALATAPRHRLHVATQDADAGALLAAFAGRANVVEGPLDLDVKLAGPLGAQALAGVTGAITLDVGAGRIPGVSPLGHAIDLLDRHREVERVLHRKKTERKLAPFLGDRFEWIRGRFDVAGGRARSDALVVQYPGYRLEIRGAIALADGALDGKGRLVLEPAIEAALADSDAPASGGVREIELARVGGTVARPKLEIDQAGALAFAASLALAQKRDKWERKLDKTLGDGKGGALLDALDGILGKKERR